MPTKKQKRKHDMRFLNGPGRHNGNLTERLNILVTPQMMKDVQLLLNTGSFPNVSEFGRYVIRKYLDERGL